MRNAKSSVIRSPMRAVVPPSVMPCLPAVPKMAPTMPLTMPLRIKPAPRAASQPSATPTQLVPLSASEDDLYPELRPDSSLSLRASSTLRGPVPPRPSERTSFSSTLGASVLPSLFVIRLLLSSVVLVGRLACFSLRPGLRSGPWCGRRAARPLLLCLYKERGGSGIPDPPTPRGPPRLSLVLEAPCGLVV